MELSQTETKELRTQRLNVTVLCQAVYNSGIDVPFGLSFEESLKYAKEHMSEIPLTSLEYVSGSDVLDEENCDLEETTLKPGLDTVIAQAEIDAGAGREKEQDESVIYLFAENRSGERMGKPGDYKNVYHAKWFEFYSFGEDGEPRHEKTSLNFTSGGVAVPGGNGISEVDALEAFRAEHTHQKIVVLRIKYSQKELGERMAEARSEYKKGSKEPMLVFPPEPDEQQQTEPTR